MGNITKKPKAPEPQIVYVSQPAQTQTTPQTIAPSEPVETPEQERERNLLARGRSRLGTILTGFRGILSPIDPSAQRKTLLGE
jgi:hypothetical protein